MPTVRKVWAWIRASSETFGPEALGYALYAQKRRFVGKIADKIKAKTGAALGLDITPALTMATMPKAGQWVGRRIIVLHDADKAGRHVDMYLSDGQTAWSIGVKRLEKGEPIEILHREFAQRGWLAQSTTHTDMQARAEWGSRDKGPQTYGAGRSRRVISDVGVRVTSDGQKATWYDPDLGGQAYVYKIMEQNNLRPRNILSIGLKRTPAPVFEDRLHLKMDADKAKFLGRVSIVTEKIDGAATHFVINKDGARFFSPRVFAGERIEYTHKLGNLADLRLDVQVKGMGELVFKRPGNTETFRVLGAETAAKRAGIGQHLTAAQIGGILNAKTLPAEHLEPRIYVYRIDSVGKLDVLREPYEVNYERCKHLSTLHPFLSIPIRVDDASSWAHGEGLVGTPANESILSGRKWKVLPDPYDWVLEEVNLHNGDKGGIAGTCVFRSESGKQFKLGASAMGDKDFVNTVMAQPEVYIGRTFKVSGFVGHEGRAARIEPHADK